MRLNATLSRTFPTLRFTPPPQQATMLTARRVAGVRMGAARGLARPATVSRSRTTKAMAFKVTLKTPSGKGKREHTFDLGWTCFLRRARAQHPPLACNRILAYSTSHFEGCMNAGAER